MELIRNFPDSEILANLRTDKNMAETVKALYRHCFESLSWYIQHNNGSLEDAEDIFQEVLVSFIEMVRNGKFRGESSVKTFLFSLNRYTWLNELKRRGRQKVREEKFENARDTEMPDTSDFIAGRESRNELLKLVGKLGDTCRKILLLFYYENLSMREILDQTDYETEQVVRNKKYKCLKQLEQMIRSEPAIRDNLKNLLHG